MFGNRPSDNGAETKLAHGFSVADHPVVEKLRSAWMLLYKMNECTGRGPWA
jgi:hypothetical protein